MSTITITITAPAQDFSTFADELGYMTQTPLPDGSYIANTQTKQQFLEAYFKNVTIGELYRRKATTIDQQVRDSRDAEKAAIKAAISGAVGVTSVI
jgi:hypothetical protein